MLSSIKFVKQLILICALFTVFSCEKDGVNKAGHSESLVDDISHGYSNGNTNNSADLKTVQNRKVIWKARLDFQVKEVDESTGNIKSIAQKHGAFVSDMRLTSEYSKTSNKITLRVENSKFENLLNDIKGESIYMKSIDINSQDVTEEYIDIESRLKTKKEVRDRYIDILRNKTGDVKDVIAAEEAIRTITEEIEAKVGRLRYLNDQIKFSTITINIYQEVEYKKQPTVYKKPYSEKLSDGFKNGWSIISNLFLGLINIWPLLLIISVIVWKRKWIISRFK